MILTSVFRRWLLLPLVGAWPLVAMAQTGDAYLRGYVDALLDSRYAGLGLRALAVEQERVTLGARTCLGPSQKRDIELLLQRTGKVSAVVWDDSTDCDKPAVPVVTQPGEPVAKSVEFRALPERELFTPLIADPRQPRFSMSYQYYRTPRDSFNAASVAFGEYFGLAQGSFGARGTSQIGVQGRCSRYSISTPRQAISSTPITG